MFTIEKKKDGTPYLKWSEEHPPYGQRGKWVNIGSKFDEGIDNIVRINRKNGLIVLEDDQGDYRALVLTD